ncbi:hypothetical protein EJ04DRAFT_516560 [Polyplosphaeria fusca]|uniref:Uncharacterized protein n=1 Tax=Polyplosphaeria fusca TaxID=682080 RepID=A0A9P4QMR9_9PLEO|nr:hypothetical protein EJ04DRAFT_516560 [Polyplosphaeria fusca]
MGMRELSVSLASCWPVVEVVAPISAVRMTVTHSTALSSRWTGVRRASAAVVISSGVGRCFGSLRMRVAHRSPGAQAVLMAGSEAEAAWRALFAPVRPLCLFSRAAASLIPCWWDCRSCRGSARPACVDAIQSRVKCCRACHSLRLDCCVCGSRLRGEGDVRQGADHDKNPGLLEGWTEVPCQTTSMLCSFFRGSRMLVLVNGYLALRQLGRDGGARGLDATSVF